MKARSANFEPSQEGLANTNRGSPPQHLPFTTASRVLAIREVWLSSSCWFFVNAAYAGIRSMSADRVIAARAIAARNAAGVRGFSGAGRRRAATSGRLRVAGSGKPPPAVCGVITPGKKPWLIRVQQQSFLPLFFSRRTVAVARIAADRAGSSDSSPGAGMAGGRFVPIPVLEGEGRRDAA